MGVGQPTERELTCLYRTKLWEGLISFAELFEESDHDRSNDHRNHQGPVAQIVERPPKKKAVKYEYDYRVVCGKGR